MSNFIFNGIVLDPGLPTANVAAAAAQRPTVYYFLQTDGPLSGEAQSKLADLNVRTLEFIRDNTYLVHFSGNANDIPAAVPDIERVIPFMDAFKIGPNLRSPRTATAAPVGFFSLADIQVSPADPAFMVDVLLHKGVNSAQIAAQIAAVAGVPDDEVEVGRKKVRLPVKNIDLTTIAEIDSVYRIEPVFPAKPSDAMALGIMQAPAVHAANPGPNLNGAGQTITVADTGFDNGDPNNPHPAFTGRVRNLYPLGRPDQPGVPGKSNDPDGHGTHVAGSALGEANAPLVGGQISGTAPGAQLVLQSCYENAQSTLGGLPADLNDLFETPYDDDDSRVHTNSWGISHPFIPGFLAGSYMANSREIDEFVDDHRDLVVLFSAGNEGTDGNSNGVIDNGSITPPATARNCITVGASENDRTATTTSTWGGIWASDYPTNPIKDDLIADNIEGLAAFSGRGPTDDGRIKPDVVAPGSTILSAQSRSATISSIIQQIYGTSPDNLYSFLGGTSMATPLVAGCAAVIRQFLRGQGLNDPSAALVKAVLINGARPLAGQYVPAETGGIPSFAQGFGLVDLQASVGPFPSQTAIDRFDESQVNSLSTGQEQEFTVNIGQNNSTLKATLVWTDQAGSQLQNDLDLIVKAGQQERHGNRPANATDFDRVNNVEQVIWENLDSGDVKVIVRAFQTMRAQNFALVIRVTG